MPRVAPSSNFRSRAVALILVVGGHVAVLALLTFDPSRETNSPADERMTLVFVAPLEEIRSPSPGQPGRTARPSRATATRQAPTTPAVDDSTAISPAIDWRLGGSEAARRAAAEPTTRDFGFPKREPAPREKKPFAWDKTHTERVHALDGGGIGVHLSENCELALAPLPFVGCALGKPKARGDLFDEMRAPPEMGDWKDR
jgi:hypothetical protein